LTVAALTVTALMPPDQDPKTNPVAAVDPAPTTNPTPPVAPTVATSTNRTTETASVRATAQTAKATPAVAPAKAAPVVAPAPAGTNPAPASLAPVSMAVNAQAAPAPVAQPVVSPSTRVALSAAATTPAAAWPVTSPLLSAPTALHGDAVPAAPTRSAGSPLTPPSIGASLAAGLAARLLPFGVATQVDVAKLFPRVSTLAVPAAGTRPATKVRLTNLNSAGDGGGRETLNAPPLPGNANFFGSPGAFGAFALALWCDILVCVSVLTGRELRRHRTRPVLCGPVDVVSLLQRPG
jgi:hypothetical protein